MMILVAAGITALVTTLVTSAITKRKMIDTLMQTYLRGCDASLNDGEKKITVKVVKIDYLNGGNK